MRIYASATSFAPLLNGFDRFVETTTDISGVSTCPFERLILLGVILNAFIKTAIYSNDHTSSGKGSMSSPEKSLSPYAKTPSLTNFILMYTRFNSGFI